MARHLLALVIPLNSMAAYSGVIKTQAIATELSPSTILIPSIDADHGASLVLETISWSTSTATNDALSTDYYAQEHHRNKFSMPTIYNGTPITPFLPTSTNSNRSSAEERTTMSSIPPAAFTPVANSEASESVIISTSSATSALSSPVTLTAIQTAYNGANVTTLKKLRRGLFKKITDILSWPFKSHYYHSDNDDHNHNYHYTNSVFNSVLDSTCKDQLKNRTHALTYFTVINPNGSIALSYPEHSERPLRTLMYLSTTYLLTYPSALRKVIFNDPTISEECPKGHCLSKPLPGTNSLRLKRLSTPVPLCMDVSVECGYMTALDVWRAGVKLGSMGYYKRAAMPRIEIFEFVEMRMRSTYPKLEIGLILGFCLGLPALVVLWFVGMCVSSIVMRVFGSIRHGFVKIGLFIGVAWKGLKGCFAGIFKRKESGREGNWVEDVELGDMVVDKRGDLPPAYDTLSIRGIERVMM